jgi:3-methyladenine DNA glycosylase/8-oxoguanine DNA glycosylase
LLVALPEPYDFELSLERYRTFGPDLAYLWHEGALYRAIDGLEVRIAAAPGGVDVEPADEALVEPVRRLLGAPLDLGGFLEAAGADETLDAIARRLPGFRPPLAPDPFEMLVSSITAQQVSLRAALAIRNRLIVRFSAPVGRVYPFPSRDRLAAASPDELTAVGLSRRKAASIVAIARADVDLDGLAALPDEEGVARLRLLPGVGEWTAEWFLARHLGRPDAWPAGDLGLRKAVSALYGGGRELSIAETRAVGERFTPHRNLAAHYLLTAMRVLEL